MVTISFIIFAVVTELDNQARSQEGAGAGGGGEDSPPSRLKQVHFALMKKHAFLMLCLKLKAWRAGKTVPQHNFWFLKVEQLVAQAFSQLI